MTDIAKIEAVYQAALQNATSETIAAYYQALAEEGFAYGETAREVVLGTGFAGIVANNYSENKLEGDLGADYNSRRLEIQRELMMADYRERARVSWADISGRVIADYHIEVFDRLYPNLPNAHEAWAPYHIVQVLDDSESWLTASIVRQSLIFFRMIDKQLLGSTEDPAYGNAFAWVQDMRSFYVLDKRDWSWRLGDGVRDASFAEYFGKEVLDFSDSFLKPLIQHADASDARLWTGSVEILFHDAIIARNGFHQETIDALFSTVGGKLQIDMATANGIASAGNDWFGAIKLGLKASVFDGLDETTWAAITEGSTATDRLYAAIDAMSVSKITFQKGASVLMAEHQGELLLGDSTAGDFYAGNQGAFIFASGGADVLYGGAGEDILVGGAGADMITSSGYSDIMDGGSGNDVYDVTRSYEDLVAGINALEPWDIVYRRQPEIHFRPGSGHDLIRSDIYEETGSVYIDFDSETLIPSWETGAVGLEALVLEGIRSTDVQLCWDRRTGDSYITEPEEILFGVTEYAGTAVLKLSESDTIAFHLLGVRVERPSTHRIYQGIATPFKLVFEDRTVDDWDDLFDFDDIQIGALDPAWLSAPQDHAAGRPIGSAAALGAGGGWLA